MSKNAMRRIGYGLAIGQTLASSYLSPNPPLHTQLGRYQNHRGGQRIKTASYKSGIANLPKRSKSYDWDG